MALADKVPRSAEVVERIEGDGLIDGDADDDIEGDSVFDAIAVIVASAEDEGEKEGRPDSVAREEIVGETLNPALLDAEDDVVEDVLG